MVIDQSINSSGFCCSGHTQTAKACHGTSLSSIGKPVWHFTNIHNQNYLAKTKQCTGRWPWWKKNDALEKGAAAKPSLNKISHIWIITPKAQGSKSGRWATVKKNRKGVHRTDILWEFEEVLNFPPEENPFIRDRLFIPHPWIQT